MFTVSHDHVKGAGGGRGGKSRSWRFTRHRGTRGARNSWLRCDARGGDSEIASGGGGKSFADDQDLPFVHIHRFGAVAGVDLDLLHGHAISHGDEPQAFPLLNHMNDGTIRVGGGGDNGVIEGGCRELCKYPLILSQQESE